MAGMSGESDEDMKEACGRSAPSPYEFVLLPILEVLESLPLLLNYLVLPAHSIAIKEHGVRWDLIRP